MDVSPGGRDSLAFASFLQNADSGAGSTKTVRTAALLDLSRLTAEEARTGQREITVDPSGRIVGLHTAFDQRTFEFDFVTSKPHSDATKKRILGEGLAAMGLATGGAGHGDDPHRRHLHAEHNDEGEADDGAAYLRAWTMVCLGSASQPLLNWGLGPLFAEGAYQSEEDGEREACYLPAFSGILSDVCSGLLKVDFAASVYLAAFEIVNDAVRELYSGRQLNTFEKSDGDVIVEGLPTHRVTSLEAFWRLLALCLQNSSAKRGGKLKSHLFFRLLLRPEAPAPLAGGGGGGGGIGSGTSAPSSPSFLHTPPRNPAAGSSSAGAAAALSTSPSRLVSPTRTAERTPNRSLFERYREMEPSMLLSPIHPPQDTGLYAPTLSSFPGFGGERPKSTLASPMWTPRGYSLAKQRSASARDEKAGGMFELVLLAPFDAMKRSDQLTKEESAVKRSLMNLSLMIDTLKGRGGGGSAAGALGWRSSTLTHLLKRALTATPQQGAGLLHMVALTEPIPYSLPFNAWAFQLVSSSGSARRDEAASLSSIQVSPIRMSPARSPDAPPPATKAANGVASKSPATKQQAPGDVARGNGHNAGGSDKQAGADREESREKELQRLRKQVALHKTREQLWEKERERLTREAAAAEASGQRMREREERLRRALEAGNATSRALQDKLRTVSAQAREQIDGLQRVVEDYHQQHAQQQRTVASLQARLLDAERELAAHRAREGVYADFRGLVAKQAEDMAAFHRNLAALDGAVAEEEPSHGRGDADNNYNDDGYGHGHGDSDDGDEGQRGGDNAEQGVEVDVTTDDESVSVMTRMQERARRRRGHVDHDYDDDDDDDEEEAATPRRVEEMMAGLHLRAARGPDQRGGGGGGGRGVGVKRKETTGVVATPTHVDKRTRQRSPFPPTPAQPLPRGGDTNSATRDEEDSEGEEEEVEAAVVGDKGRREEEVKLGELYSTIDGYLHTLSSIRDSFTSSPTSGSRHATP